MDKIDTRDNSEWAIRERYKAAMLVILDLSVEHRRVICPALTDVIILLRELHTMMPIADEMGSMSLNNELLKEEVSMLTDVLHEFQYEQNVTSYSDE